MKFTQAKMEAINERFADKKANNVGLDIEVYSSLRGAVIAKDNLVFADVEELGRFIVELQMLKEAIEEETGLVL